MEWNSPNGVVLNRTWIFGYAPVTWALDIALDLIDVFSVTCILNLIFPYSIKLSVQAKQVLFGSINTIPLPVIMNSSCHIWNDVFYKLSFTVRYFSIQCWRIRLILYHPSQGILFYFCSFSIYSLLVTIFHIHLYAHQHLLFWYCMWSYLAFCTPVNVLFDYICRLPPELSLCII